MAAYSGSLEARLFRTVHGGVNPDPTHVFVNYVGISTLNTHVGDLIDGLTFIPNAAGNLDGTWDGAIYSGNRPITLLSQANLNGATPVPDDGCTFLLLALGAGMLLIASRRFRSA